MENLPENLSYVVEWARQAKPTYETTLRSLHSLDLTSLNDNDTPAVIDALAAKADQGDQLGHVAALCVYPQFLSQIFNAVSKNGIDCATVINFPSGKGTPGQTVEDIAAAIESGANEIDIVLDYKSFLAGDCDKAALLLHVARETCGDGAKLKVILESSVFGNYRDLYKASRLALDAGADFLKTSTGKDASGGASLEAAATMLQAIKDSGRDAGLKISGGVKTVDDCAQYIFLTESMMGKGWIDTSHFRIGASSVLTNIMEILNQGSHPTPGPQARTPEY